MRKYIIRIISPLHNVEWEETIESNDAMKVSEYVHHLAETHLNKGFKLSVDSEQNMITYSDGETEVTGTVLV